MTPDGTPAFLQAGDDWDAAIERRDWSAAAEIAHVLADDFDMPDAVRRCFALRLAFVGREAQEENRRATARFCSALLKVIQGLEGPDCDELRWWASVQVGRDAVRVAAAARCEGDLESARAAAFYALDMFSQADRSAPADCEQTGLIAGCKSAALLELARALRAQGESDGAYDVLFQALVDGLKAEDGMRGAAVAQSLNEMGMLKGAQGKHRTATDFHLRAIAALLAPDADQLSAAAKGEDPPDEAAMLRTARRQRPPPEDLAALALNLAASQSAMGLLESAVAWSDLATNLVARRPPGGQSDALRQNVAANRAVLRLDAGHREDGYAIIQEASAQPSQRDHLALAYNRLAARLAAGGDAEDRTELTRLLANVAPQRDPELALSLRLLWIAYIGRPDGDRAGVSERIADAWRIVENMTDADPHLAAAVAHADACRAYDDDDMGRAVTAISLCLALSGRSDQQHILPAAWRLAGIIAESLLRPAAAVLFRKIGIRARQQRRDRLFAARRGMTALAGDALTYRELAELLVRLHRFSEAREVQELEAMAELDGMPLPDDVPYRPGRAPSFTEAEAALLASFEQPGTLPDPKAVARWIESAAVLDSHSKANAPTAQWAADARFDLPPPAAGEGRTAMLAYLPTAHALTILVTIEGRTYAVETAVAESRLAAEQFDLLEALRRPDRQVQELAIRAYRTFVAPVQSLLDAAGVTTLLLEPGPITATLPLAALHTGTGWLVRRYAMARLPPVRSLDLRRPVQRPPRLALFANEEGSRVTVLEGATAEVSDIAALAGDWLMPGGVCTGGRATLEALEAAVAAGATVLHLATHAAADPADPSRSRIALAGGRWVQVSVLRRLDLSGVDLTVLSACETALPSGPLRAAAGIDTLLLEAGARATLASLYRASDESTPRLMAVFYRALLGSPFLGKAEALRRAQCAVLDESRFEHPYFWSGFVLTGNTLGLN